MQFLQNLPDTKKAKKPVTFRTWLKDQEHRHDPIGDIARDAKYDKNFPRCESGSSMGCLKRRYHRHLDEHRACAGAYEAMDKALEEFDQSRRKPSPHPTRAEIEAVTGKQIQAAKQAALDGTMPDRLADEYHAPSVQEGCFNSRPRTILLSSIKEGNALRRVWGSDWDRIHEGALVWDTIREIALWWDRLCKTSALPVLARHPQPE